MDFISKLLDMDFGAMVPPLDTVLTGIRIVLSVFLLAGPVIMLLLGGAYLLLAPPEANYRFGFRTYFGMGSVEAWKYSQKVAGIAFAAVGLILTVIMIVVISDFGDMDAFQMAETTLTYLLWQAGAALLVRLVVAILCAVFFNPDGTRRREK